MSRLLNPFARPGRWYRGVWHCHTTESDGARSVEDAVAWYAGRPRRAVRVRHALGQPPAGGGDAAARGIVCATGT